MSKVKISLKDPTVAAIWNAAIAAKKNVESWPPWKRGEDSSSVSTVTVAQVEPKPR